MKEGGRDFASVSAALGHVGQIQMGNPGSSGSFRDPGCWMVGASCHQGGDKFAEEGFAAAAGVMYELEEAEIGGQLLLRDATMRP